MHPKFPCTKYVRLVSQTRKIMVPILYGTFGNDTRCLVRVSRRLENKRTMFQVHLSNEAGRRNRRLGKGELFPHWTYKRLNKKLESHNKYAELRIKKRILRIIDLVSHIKGLIVLGVGMEDNYTSAGAKVIHDWAREVWPYRLSRNPVSNRTRGRFDYTESHGLFPVCRRTIIANSDGSVVRNPYDFRARSADCSAGVLWEPAAQGITGRAFVQPRDRTFHIPPESILKYRIFIGRQ